MTDFLSAVSLERAIAIARDIGFIIGLVVFGWKGRSWFQPVLDFFKRANGHMDRMEAGLDKMETGMNTLLNNHMHHMQEHLETLANDAIDAKKAIVERDKRRDKKPRRRG